MRALMALAIALSAVAVVRADDRPTILCIGDSITAGGKGYPVYRWHLAPMLREADRECRFIGPHQDQAGGHFGNGGRNTAWLSQRAAEVYRQHPADFVLIHSGHNSFSKDQPVPGILEDTAHMIRAIHAINPKVTLLVAQVIESGKLPKYGYIRELNRQLPALAQTLAREGMQVSVVNVAAGFDWKTDTLEDQVHPNEEGAKKMARAWFEALQPLLAAKGP